MPKSFEHPASNSDLPPTKSGTSGIRPNTPPTGEEEDVSLFDLNKSVLLEKDVQESPINSRAHIARSWPVPEKPKDNDEPIIPEGKIVKADAERVTTSDQELRAEIEEAKRDVSIAFEDLTFDANPEEGLEVLKELIETNEYKAHVIKAIYPIAMEDMLRRYLNANPDLVEAYQKEPGATKLIANIYIVLRNEIASEEIIDTEDDMAA